MARTVWALLDAASKHGLDVLVPEQPLLLHPVKPAATNRSARPSSRPDASKGRASEAGRKRSGGATAIGAAERARRKVGAGGAGEETAGGGCEVYGRNGASSGRGDKGAENGDGGMDLCAQGVGKGQLGDGDAAGDGAAASGGGSAGLDSGRGEGDDGAGVLSAGAHSESRSEPHHELGSVGTAGNFESGDSSMDDTGSSWTENGATIRMVRCPEVAAFTVTTRSGGKKHVSAVAAEEEQQIAPPPPLVAREGGENPTLPPKPKMSQVIYCCILPLYPSSHCGNSRRKGTTICRHVPLGEFADPTQLYGFSVSDWRQGWG